MLGILEDVKENLTMNEGSTGGRFNVICVKLNQQNKDNLGV